MTIMGYGATMRMWGGDRGAHGRPDYFNRTAYPIKSGMRGAIEVFRSGRPAPR